MRQNATIICDLQFGSTGKGLIAGYLAKRDKPDCVITAWSMNAGHTFINAEGRKYVHCMLANGVVSENLRTVLIGPGSAIGLDCLIHEMLACADHLEHAEVLIHPQATIIEQHHIDAEAGPMLAIGSTRKGCGEALIEKIRRRPGARITAGQISYDIGGVATYAGVNLRVCTHKEYLERIDTAERIQVEGAQGYSLGMLSGYYPFVTSRECTPAQIASDCLLPLPKIERVVGTMRTYPIRVANRFDSEGKQVGTSGPCYEDQVEISFENIGQKVEQTTVTKLPRRIFTFSEEQCSQAMFACRPDEVFLNFANYVKTDAVLNGLIQIIDGCASQHECGTVKYLGYGASEPMVRLRGTEQC